MKQKLGLCCALIHEPELLILDEPTTGVDPLSRRQFWQLIDDIIRQQHPDMSVLVATAYMDEAKRFDWLATMNNGEVLASDLHPTFNSNLNVFFRARFRITAWCSIYRAFYEPAASVRQRQPLQR